jgi:peptide/nickel transport system permease protein
MLTTAQRFISDAPWMALWPGLMIFVVVMAFNLLGDGLRDALDPNQK